MSKYFIKIKNFVKIKFKKKFEILLKGLVRDNWEEWGSRGQGRGGVSRTKTVYMSIDKKFEPIWAPPSNKNYQNVKIWLDKWIVYLPVITTKYLIKGLCTLFKYGYILIFQSKG